MEMLVTMLLYAQGMIALVLAFHVLMREGMESRENIILTAHLFMVFLWNISYVIMIGTEDHQENLRYFARSLFMLAIIFSVIFCHVTLMRCVSLDDKTMRRITLAEVLGGLIVYPIIIARESVTFVKGSFGWTYQFNEYAGRYVYNIFIAFVWGGVAGMSIWAFRHGKRKRDRVLGGYGIICGIIMFLGMLSDTLLPMFGKEVFPGSATAMTICVIFIYQFSFKQSIDRLTVGNVSPHIFSDSNLPMLIVDEAGEITTANNAAKTFFDLSQDHIVGKKLGAFFDLTEVKREPGQKEQSFDVTCWTNGARCRMQISYVFDAYGDYLGSMIMITDLTEEIRMIEELEMYRNHLQDKLEEKTIQLESLTMQAISAIANTIDAKDEYTRGHSVHVAQYATILARGLGMGEDDLHRISYMGLLHDIGKIGVPDSILNKIGKLSATEFDLIKQHTTMGGEILKDITMVDGVAKGAKYHHERYDGKGYPEGLVGEEIPLEARIICIADAYDAMTNDRIYRRKLAPDAVIRELEQGSGTQFDPKLTALFLDLVRKGEMVLDDSDADVATNESNQLLMSIIEKQNEQTMLEANLDYLTKLYNRRAGEKEIAMAMQETCGFLMILDVDKFKIVNDTLGHLQGDNILRTAADCMKENAPKDAIVCRQGGDEFLIFLPGITEKEQALAAATRIRKAFLKIISENDQLVGCSFSIGISLPTEIGADFNTYFAQADKALYFVKQTGRNREFMYGEDMREAAPVITRDVSQVVQLLQSSERYTGAFAVEVRELRKVYEYVSSFANRYHYSMQILLFTLESQIDDARTLDRNEKAIDALKASIQRSLRSVDICVRYGSSQMVVILLDTNEAGVEVVTNRIITNFYKIFTEGHYDIYCDHQSLTDAPNT